MNSEVIVLQDGLEPDGTYRLHMMSNQPIERELPEGARVSRAQEAGSFVLQASWRFRGACQIVCPEIDWRRVVVLWALEKGERISEQAQKAAMLFWETFGEWPTGLRLAKLPQGVEWGTLVELPIGEMVTTESDFVPPGFLAVDNSSEVF